MNIKLNTILYTMLLSITMTSYAATDGALGNTSSGTLQATLDVDNILYLTTPTAISINANSITTIQKDTGICVYSNSNTPPTTRQYKITANSLNGTGAFLLKSATDLLPYNLIWLAADKQSHLVDGITNNTLFSGADYYDCQGSSNATLRLNIAKGDLAKIPSGTYSDSLTLTIESP